MNLERRKFLAANAALVFAGMTSSIARSAAQAQEVKVRRNISTLVPTDPIIEVYREAVTMMHDLPDSDERSWMGQARIHLDHCHRQRRHFLPWHRLYTQAFEEIVRELTGYEEWALPYWDWTNFPQIPGVCFGEGEPLDTLTWDDPDPESDPNSDRVMGPNDTISSATVDLSRVVNQRVYQVFSDRLDFGPHGGVHVAIGGHMGRFLSPLDPIFMLHHCNVDRIWADWSRSNANPTEAAWLDEGFDNMFVDRSGGPITGVTAGDLLDIEALGYTYDQLSDPEPAVEIDVEDLDARFSAQGVGATNDVTSVVNIPTSIAVPAPERLQLPRNFFDKELLRLGRAEKQVVARLSDIKIPADAENYVIRVFLNCPYLSKDVPTDDPHFVAEVNLFGLRQMPNMEMPSMSLLVDLTETMVNLNLRQTPVTEQFEVQLMPVPVDGRSAKGIEFKVGRVDILAI